MKISSEKVDQNLTYFPKDSQWISFKEICMDDGIYEPGWI